jgi:enamine deaminase RidA (YjgF/YER057c/UK114 family)
MFSRITNKTVLARRYIHVEKRIQDLGYMLPAQPAAPKGNYMNYSRVGNVIYFSGHLPILVDGTMIKGRLGHNMSIEDGHHAARIAGLQLLASAQAAVGDLDKIKRVLRVTGFVNSSPDFTDQPKVINGCSDMFGAVFGVDIARHARSAVGVNTLPLGVAVEIEAIMEVSD